MLGNYAIHSTIKVLKTIVFNISWVSGHETGYEKRRGCVKANMTSLKSYRL